MGKINALAYFLLNIWAMFPAAAHSSYQMVWHDEFEQAGTPDPGKWNHEIGGWGWGNNELQNYTGRLENARVENGLLVIEARKESFEGNTFTSAKLTTRGLASWKYGRFEIRAKLPKGRGTWPAIWMMPVNKTYSETLWPDNGEIDIMEHVGSSPNLLLACLYSKEFNWMKGNGKTGTLEVPGLEEDFHLFSLEWTPEFATMAVDGIPYNHAVNPQTSWEAWPFSHDFYLILNLAVGGYGGQRGIDETVFPQKFLVDYVRVFQDIPSQSRQTGVQ